MNLEDFPSFKPMPNMNIDWSNEREAIREWKLEHERRLKEFFLFMENWGITRFMPPARWKEKKKSLGIGK